VNEDALISRIEQHLEKAHREGKHEDIVDEQCPLCESEDSEMISSG
jgi:hypothetical protein